MLSEISFKKLSECSFLKEMFYISLYVPKGQPPFPKTIIEQPHLSKYWKNWGNASDSGIVAVHNNQKIGAIWSRFFTETNKGYGFVNEDSPEIGIAIKEGFRGQGLGGMLFEKLFEELKQQGVKSVSLSVSAENQAANLYLRLGFEILKKEEMAYLMFKKLD